MGLLLNFLHEVSKGGFDNSILFRVIANDFSGLLSVMSLQPNSIVLAFFPARFHLVLLESINQPYH